MDELKYNLDQSLAELDKLLDLSAKETDKTACETLAEKARIIYEEHPESEDIALRYARILFNLSVEQGNVEELLNTANSIKQIFELFKQSEDIALHYARTLVNLSVEQVNVEERKNTTNLVKEIFEGFTDSEDIALRYAMVLVNLSVEQVSVEERKNTANLVKKIFEQFEQSGNIALQYAMVLYNLSNRQNEIKERKETISEIETLTLKFQHSENIALHYAMALVNLSVEQVNVEERKNTTNLVKEIFEGFTDSEDIALQYAMVLVNLSIKQVNIEELADTVNSVKKIFEQFKQSEDIALRYAMVLVNLSAEQVNVEELADTVNSVKKIFEQFKQSEDIALQYAMVLVNLSIKQVNIEELADTVNSVKKIFEQFKQSEDIALRYAMVLVNLSAEQVNVEERKNTANLVKEIFEQFKQSENIALQYAMVLYNLSNRQNNVEERKEYISEIEALTLKFQHSEEIALRYAMALVNLSAKQINVEERGNTANSVKQIFEQFKQSEEIALQYAKVLFNLAILQNERDKIGDTVKQTLAILTNLSSVEIFKIVVEILEKNPDTPLDTNNTPSTSITKILDKLCFYSNDDFDRKLLIRALNLDLVINTKYDILKDWIKRYKDDENKLNQLIDIYRIVQEIKYQLGLKAKDKNSNLKFGHYTKGKTLQNLLDQDTGKTDDTKFSVSGKTRLYNANYMNDPEEGVVIEEILEPSKDGERTSYFEKRNILDPSPWFLMSFTSKTDDLTMWSQYGDDAQGVCLVLKEDDFSRFTSFNDVSWRRETTSLEFINKIDLSMSELSSDLKISANEAKKKEQTFSARIEEIQHQPEKKDKVAKGNIDYLYRIAYVNDSDGEFSIEKTELFNDDEIKKLEEFLEALKEKIDKNLNKRDDFYQKAISDCIEEIRYLFKSVDYKYENELRILRYANLDPSNDKIKIDKTSGIGRLYVERENSIQIDEVIFGPKFPNPEYVTPLLKLLDKKINYKKSTIKFR